MNASEPSIGSSFDLLVVGGGVNGAGVARDAAGRGLSVLLLEKDDLASATSSWSSKLVHGGLRYLELYEFRLVAEALTEREVMLATARHLVWPARFIMPHVPELRPRWMIRAGLFLYDHLSRRTSLPGSTSVRLDGAPYDHGLQAKYVHGFIYSDCRVDDARLVVCTAMSARDEGATVVTRTECAAAARDADGWKVTLRGPSGEREIHARGIVNAAGPWVKRVLNERLAQPSRDAVKLVKDSHIVVPKLYEGEHAFILQNDDRRVVFMIPYEGAYTLVGTTDIAVDKEDAPVASDAEVEYLCRAVNRYLAKSVAPKDVVWRYSGVRPLYDDGTSDPSAITRDYTLRVDDESGRSPVLSVFGGKITTYRRLAEHVMDRLAPYYPGMKPAWTAGKALPGSDFGDGGRDAAREAFFASHPAVGRETLRGIFRRHGSRATDVVGDGRLGEHYGAGLHEREVQYLVEREWARSADDVLWRRTKCGLHMTEAQRARVAAVLGR